MSFWRRLEPFLYSRRNIVGSGLALGGLALYFTGLLAGPLGLPVVGALYAIGVLVVPAERGLALQLSAAQDTGRIRAGLDDLLRSIRNRVALDIYARVVSIRDSILLTLPADSAVDAADPNVYLIQQTALTYLPQALAAYLAVPRAFAERRAVAGGRTPHDVLLEQLDLMASKMQEVADDLARHDSDRLLANGRFLAERFSASSLQVGSGAVAVPAAAAGDAATAAQTTVAPVADDERASNTREHVH
jgi:hypothetical protein